MRTRFAPSPTGALHLGHAYAAGFATALAKKQGGECLLRFEDIDITRVRAPFYQAIIDDLASLHLSFPSPHLRQTSRSAAYQSALDHLIDQKLVYPCFCTRKQIEAELAHITNAPHGPEGALYPRTCMNLSESQINAQLARGAIPAWRLNTTEAKKLFPKLTFTDNLHGTTAVQVDLLGDLILARKDIGTSYHIAVVVDDAFQEITDVTRGDDLILSTHIHRLLQAALHLPEPTYHHHRLIHDAEGNRLAKRHDSMSIKELLKTGHTSEEIWSMVAPIL